MHSGKVRFISVNGYVKAIFMLKRTVSGFVRLSAKFEGKKISDFADFS